MSETIISLLQKAITFVVAFYVLALLLLYVFQNALLFPSPDTSRFEIEPDAKDASQMLSDGTVLRHIRFPADEGASKLIYFHGNGDAALFSQGLGRLLNDAGFDVLLAEYRGYGGSDGAPSAIALKADALEIYDWYAGSDDGSVFVMAHSLGTGIAAYLSSSRKVRALALVSSYASLADVAAHHYPYFPVRTLFSNHVYAGQYLGEVAPPAIFFHGKNDLVIPLKFGKELYDAVGADKKVWNERLAQGHNDILDEELVEKVVRFFKALAL